MVAGNQRDRFFIIHRHAGEGLADIAGRRDGIRISIGPLRIYVNETHLNRAQGVVQLAVARVAFVSQPLVFGPPENVFRRFPDILAAAGETEGLESHRFQCDVSARIMRSAQESLRPYFCLTGQSSRRALSRFALSGQLLRGANRCVP